MSRQYVRLADVRPPVAPDVAQSTDQLTANSYTASNADDFLSTVLSQIRILTGQGKWQDPPVASISQITNTVVSQTQVIQAIAPVVLNTATTTVDQAQAIQALQQAVLAANTQVATLQAMLAALQSQENAAVTQANLQAVQAALQGGIDSVTTQVSALALQTQSEAAQQAQNAAAIAALQAQVLSNSATLFDQRLLGVQNSLNQTFLTAVPFRPSTIRLYYNGQRLVSGTGNDYVVSAGGATVGLQQIFLTTPAAAPRPRDLLLADYIPA